ncbi:MAG: TetR/AcrR family transcriptional regulator [Propionibacteriaceae bacterium]|jgi:AcrR family transcriptional regulator|nr:TetR/AcrR family transcriptional regulator [Propionibacteriaceae bacterium]
MSKKSTREAILEATFAVIGERGIKGATTRLIAEKAGVNEVTLFRQFGSKNKLIQTAVNTRMETVARESVHYTGDIEADLVSLADGVKNTLELLGPVARAMLAELPLNPELSAGIRGPKELFAVVSAMLGRYQQEGRLAPEPHGTLVPAFLGPIFVRYIVMDVAAAPEDLTATPFDPTAHVQFFLHGREQGDEL